MKNEKFIGMVLIFKEPEIYILNDSQIEDIKDTYKNTLMRFLKDKNEDIEIIKIAWGEKSYDEEGDSYSYVCEQLDMIIKTTATLDDLQYWLNQIASSMTFCSTLEVDEY